MKAHPKWRKSDFKPSRAAQLWPATPLEFLGLIFGPLALICSGMGWPIIFLGGFVVFVVWCMLSSSPPKQQEVKRG